MIRIHHVYTMHRHSWLPGYQQTHHDVPEFLPCSIGCPKYK